MGKTGEPVLPVSFSLRLKLKEEESACPFVADGQDYADGVSYDTSNAKRMFGKAEFYFVKLRP